MYPKNGLDYDNILKNNKKEIEFNSDDHHPYYDWDPDDFIDGKKEKSLKDTIAYLKKQIKMGDEAAVHRAKKEKKLRELLTRDIEKMKREEKVLRGVIDQCDKSMELMADQRDEALRRVEEMNHFNRADILDID